MDLQTYRIHQAKFHTDNNIPLDLSARINKLCDEVIEFLDEPSADEATDILNVILSILCDCYGVKDPLLKGMLKLEQTSRKYLANQQTPGR